MAESNQKDQKHPQESRDREVASQLLSAEATDYNLAELARLRIRYRGFPGARNIQADLDKALERWQLTEEALFAKTRELHAQQGGVYEAQSNRKGREDWS